MKPFAFIGLLAGAAWGAQAQGLDPAKILKPGGEWPTLNGDYSGRRSSPLTQINKGNAGKLEQAWKFSPGAGVIKGTPLMVNGVLYLTVPDHVWAVEAATGLELWHFTRPSRGDRI